MMGPNQTCSATQKLFKQQGYQCKNSNNRDINASIQCSNGSVTSNGDVALTDLISFHSMSDPFKPVRGAPLHVRHFREDGQ